MCLRSGVIMSYADVAWRETENAIPFGKSFVNSEAFRVLFREGMTLVEDAAAYLDGAGRDESKALERQASLTYASESMRLTTRLMQIASWLLVQRAVSEGEISPQQALQEKNRVRLSTHDKKGSPEDIALLPDHLQKLLHQSMKMHRRILHLDQLVSIEGPLALLPESPVAVQQWLIQNAFQAQQTL
jgi:regulator of CtrA degradation